MSVLRALRHPLILHLRFSLIKALPPMCAKQSNHFYDLPLSTSIVYSLLLCLVKSGSSSFLTEWHHHHLVSIHLLIAAGYGDHLGPGWYLAFIMPHVLHKRASVKHCQPLLRPQNICMILHEHSQEIKLTH